jgi:hypothetical protein
MALPFHWRRLKFGCASSPMPKEEGVAQKLTKRQWKGRAIPHNRRQSRSPSPSHLITQSSHHQVVSSPHHPVTPSPSHPITQSSHHPVTPSPHHPPHHPVSPSPHHRFLTANTSRTGARSPLQLIRRGASRKISLNLFRRYSFSICGVAWFESTTGPVCRASHSTVRS